MTRDELDAALEASSTITHRTFEEDERRAWFGIFAEYPVQPFVEAMRDAILDARIRFVEPKHVLAILRPIMERRRRVALRAQFRNALDRRPIVLDREQHEREFAEALAEERRRHPRMLTPTEETADVE